MRSRQFTDGVPREVVGPNTPRLQQPPQRHLQSEQRRLRELRTIQTAVTISLFYGPHDLPQGQAQFPDHLVQHTGEHRERLVQLPPHTRPLTALAGADERQFARPDRARRHHVRPGLPLGKRVQPAQQVGAVGGGDGRPVVERGAGGGQCVGEVAQDQVGPLFEVAQQLGGLTVQRFLVPARDQERWQR
ncbi:hypothetical protein GCM10018775_30870 [Streptomyces umbrinus]|nr:hypothetical protein GCM10018775_30870 [Streptomyces umbrinus]